MTDINVNEKGSSFPALRYRGYQLFWAGTTLLSMGVWMSNVSQMWLIQELTESPFFLGLVNFMWGLPVIVFSLLGGVVADRTNRTKLIAGTRSISVVLALILGGLVATGIVEVWHVLTYSLLSGLIMSFEIPSRQALIPNLVHSKDLTNAIALHSAIWSGSNIMGPAVAGVLIEPLGIPANLYLTAGVYALAVVFFFRTGRYAVSSISVDTGESVLSVLKDGLRYIRGHRMVFSILALVLVPTVFGQAYVSVMPAFAADTLQGDAATYGYLLSATGIGAFAATVLLSWFGNVGRKGLLLILSGVVMGLSLLILATINSISLSLLCLLIVGAASAVFWTLSSTLIQGLVEDRVRGRVMSVYMLTWGMMSFGSLTLGVLGSLLGVPAAIAIGAVLTLLWIGAVLYKVPDLKEL